MKPSPTRPRHLTIVPDWPARVELQNRDLAEKREEARKDVGKIITLWTHRIWQEKHGKPKGGDAA